MGGLFLSRALTAKTRSKHLFLFIFVTLDLCSGCGGTDRAGDSGRLPADQLHHVSHGGDPTRGVLVREERVHHPLLPGKTNLKHLAPPFT